MLSEPPLRDGRALSSAAGRAAYVRRCPEQGVLYGVVQRDRDLGAGEGFEPPALPGDAFLDVTLDHLFAEVWSRPGLDLRARHLVTLTVLICLGREATLKLHLGAALRSGQLTDAEVDELVVHVAHHGGWPVPAVASQVVRQIRAERAAAGRE